MSVKSLRNGANGGFWGPEAAQPGTPGPLALEWMQERLPAETTGGYISSQPRGKMEIPVYSFDERVGLFASTDAWTLMARSAGAGTGQRNP